MGCVSPREQADVDVQSKEIQLQIILCSVENIRNGFFFLNDGDTITREHLASGYQNMQNIVSGMLTKYTGGDELLKKFIIPFALPDGTYQFRDILICFYLNSRSTSAEKVEQFNFINWLLKAKAIVQLLYKEKEILKRSEIRNIFQRIFKSVVAYSNSLVDKYQIPKPKPIPYQEQNKPDEQKNDKKDKIEEEKKQQPEEKKIEEENKDKKDQNTDETLAKNEEIQQSDENKAKKEEKNETTQEINQEQPSPVKRKWFKRKKVEKILNKEVEEFFEQGNRIANRITKSILKTKNETISVDDFAEKCETFIPRKFGRDIMWPRSVRLYVYEEYDRRRL